MTDNGLGSEELDEKIAFSIADFLAFQRKLEADPDSVSDEQIRAEYGEDIPANELRELFRRRTFNKETKAPRASARAKLRRRLAWLDRSLEEVEDAIYQVVGSPGNTYKQKELDDLLAAIEQFRATVTLPKQKSLPAIDADMLERMLSRSQLDWSSISADPNDTANKPT